MICCKPYTEATAADFRGLFADRFDADASILDEVLANPARADRPETGLIAYGERGEVVGVMGMMPRVVYWRQTRQMAAAAVAMAVRKDADRSFFTDFIRDAVVATKADIMVANTTIPGSRKRFREAIGISDGPASCAAIRERVLHGRLGRLLRALRGRRSLPDGNVRIMASEGVEFARERTIDAPAFDRFWTRYLETNRGLVSSRTAAELGWIFARGLASGETVLVTARRNGALVGHLFCRRTDETASCWRIADMIAVDNDLAVLDALISATERFLRRFTPAACFQVTGFPQGVQPLLERRFPASHPIGFNKCVWKCLNENAESLLGGWTDDGRSWYGCPYDGDMCLI